MTIRLNSATIVENQRNYPAENVERLRVLLTTGATAYPDIHRENFYDVVEGPRVYFIHVSPPTNKVMLLATWLTGKQSKLQEAMAG
ncbi:MAG: hypothetical protein ACYDA9_13915 [Terriglobia bacterium]